MDRIRVAVRIRPPHHGGGDGANKQRRVDAASSRAPYLHARGAEVEVTPSPRPLTSGAPASSAGANHTPLGHVFALDAVLGGECGQAAVYDACARDIVDEVLEAGVSGAVLTYGMTGAGKTYTMSGSVAGGGATVEPAWGIMPRALLHVLGDATPPRRTVRMSYLEIYKERLIDLLAGCSPAATTPLLAGGGDDDHRVSGDSSDSSGDDDAPSSPPSPPRRRGGTPPSLQPQEDARGRVTVRGLTVATLTSAAQALTLLAAGDAARSVAEHALNASSSRSHAVLTLHIEQELLPPPAAPAAGGASAGGGDGAASLLVAVSSTLHLVDLAGSERVKLTRSEGATLTEARYINKSLAHLEQVVLALTAAAAGARGSDHGAPVGRDGGSEAPPPQLGAGRAAFGSTLPGSVASSCGRRQLAGAATVGSAPPAVGWADIVPTAPAGAAVGAAAGGPLAASPREHHLHHRHHVPFRRSKLTFLLKDALSGVCRTRLIAAVWPEHEHLGETLHTLRFAARMRNVPVRPVLQPAAPAAPLPEGALSAAQARALRAGYEAQLALLTRRVAEAAATPPGAAAGGAGDPAVAAAINALVPAARAAAVRAVQALCGAAPPAGAPPLDVLSTLAPLSHAQCLLALMLMRQRVAADAATPPLLEDAAPSLLEDAAPPPGSSWPSLLPSLRPPPPPPLLPPRAASASASCKEAASRGGCPSAALPTPSAGAPAAIAVASLQPPPPPRPATHPLAGAPAAAASATLPSLLVPLSPAPKATSLPRSPPAHPPPLPPSLRALPAADAVGDSAPSPPLAPTDVAALNRSIDEHCARAAAFAAWTQQGSHDDDADDADDDNHGPGGGGGGGGGARRGGRSLQQELEAVTRNVAARHAALAAGVGALRAHRDRVAQLAGQLQRLQGQLQQSPPPDAPPARADAAREAATQLADDFVRAKAACRAAAAAVAEAQADVEHLRQCRATVAREMEARFGAEWAARRV